MIADPLFSVLCAWFSCAAASAMLCVPVRVLFLVWGVRLAAAPETFLLAGRESRDVGDATTA